MAVTRYLEVFDSNALRCICAEHAAPAIPGGACSCLPGFGATSEGASEGASPVAACAPALAPRARSAALPLVAIAVACGVAGFLVLIGFAAAVARRLYYPEPLSFVVSSDELIFISRNTSTVRGARLPRSTSFAQVRSQQRQRCNDHFGTYPSLLHVMRPNPSLLPRRAASVNCSAERAPTDRT